MKKNRKDGFCECGKELSQEEIKNGKAKCENCIGKKAGKAKKIFNGVAAVFTSIAGIAILVVTKGKKGGKL